MRIASIVPSLRRTAPIFVATELCEGFRARGHNVTMFHLDDRLEIEPVVPHDHLAWRGLRRLQDFDIVHSHMLRPDLLAAVATCILRPRPRFVSTVHNYVREDVANTHGRWMAAPVSRVWTAAWRRLDACVVLSQDARTYYSPLMPRQELAVIPSGRKPHRTAVGFVSEDADLRRLRERYCVIGANALLSRRKGLEQILRVMPQLPDHAFVLVGDGPERQALIKMARDLGVRERFVDLGFKDNARNYLDYYDIYAMPSRSEGQGLALLEAAAASLPVVCSRLPVFEEIFDRSQAAFFDLDDMAGLRDALRRAWDERTSLGPAARKRFEEAYSTDAMVEAYLSLFRRLTAGGPP